MRAATSASSSTPSTTPSASTPPSATARLLSSRQTSRYPKPPDITMINTLSQKLPCLTYGVQSSTVTVIPWRPLGDGIGSSNARFQPAIFTEFVTSLFHMRGSDSDEIGPVSLSMVMPCAINETAAFDCNITKSGLFLPIEVIQK